MFRLTFISILIASFQVSAQQSDSFVISTDELKTFLNDMYRQDRHMKRDKFDCCVEVALTARFVKKVNDEFHVLDEEDWPVILKQIESSKEMAIDNSYISKAKFVDEPTIESGIYTEISFPLFNRTKDICILRVASLGFCSSYEIRVYKKNAGKWELYKSL